MELAILTDIVIIFAFATAVNYIFTKLRIPTIIGYLLTGIVVGPSLLGVIKSPHEIEFMAEIGIILLMFTLGLEFSLNHLIKIRNIVFLGGFIQLVFTAGVTALVARTYDMTWGTAVFTGFLTALSSTALVLKILQEKGEVTSNYGRTVVGILIFQDIILIPMLLLTPMLGGQTADIGERLLAMGTKTLFMVGLVYVANRWIMPRVLHLIALTKNQELFLMSILLVCLAVALLSSQMGLSLAFGAFLGGLMISRSEYSEDAFSHLIPFKDTFTSFFFVSIGMLLDLNFLFHNIILVFATVAVVIAVKAFVAGGTAFVLGHTFKGTIMVGFAMAQIGEFSFILAKTGQEYNILSEYFYQLFLAVTIVSMAVSPFLMMVAKPASNLFLKLPIPELLIKGLFPLHEIEVPAMQNHIVFIGKDSRSLALSRMSCQMKLPYVSIVFDPALARARQAKGEMVVYGDALNEPILRKAYVETAEVVVISIGDAITALGVVERVRLQNKHAYIIVRSRHVADIEDLYEMGADQVIPEEFETAIEMFERILKKLLVPKNEIEAAIDHIRDDNYGIFRDREENNTFSLSEEIPDVEIVALKASSYPMFAGNSLKDIQLRKEFGVTLVATKRGGQIFENPGAGFVFEPGDILYVLGKHEKIAQLKQI
ncbi:MAG TPA: cation:proton antiporter [Prolixibacteraceae bacterium]|nr:cation:proton antiporter [Prolixibacteraceae bacterium]HPR84656.1 cation:proton antiporter [Prolixibacteraceae bacterium]